MGEAAATQKTADVEPEAAAKAAALEAEKEAGATEARSKAKGRVQFWLRCLMMAILISAAYQTNPGKSDDGFRDFLQTQRTSGIIHRLAESLGFTSRVVSVWNLGIAAIGREESRFFVGIFGCWIETPWGDSGPMTDLDRTRKRDVDAIMYTFLILWGLWGLWPNAMARHCVASRAFLRAGRVWTLVTAQLSHSQLLQLTVNTLLLYSIGPQAHTVMGRRHFFALFLLGGGCAMVGKMWCNRHKERTSVECFGAGGSLCALLGYLYADGHTGAGFQWQGRDWSWEQFALILLALGVMSGLDVMGHLFGGYAGVIAAKWHLLELISVRTCTEMQHCWL